MDKITLKKVQFVQLEIAKEIKKVCEENNIKYFLTAGTLLGAVRHKGFIPWDDDLDMAMLKEDYDRFIQIAPQKMSEKYELETWHTDSNCPYEFAKIRKKGTVYIEGKSNSKKEPGIYVDLICYVNAPEDKEERDKVHDEMLDLHRLLLMKCGFQPWLDNGKVNWKKRMGYLLYQYRALFYSREKLIEKFEQLQNMVEESPYLFGMTEAKKYGALEKKWYEKSVQVPFEDAEFSIPAGYDGYLKICYGDYMQLPPEGERENRHQIIKVEFGE